MDIYDPVNSDLPVVSIAIAPDDLWDPEIGMHVTGDAFFPWYPYYGSNFWNDWEKEVHIEFYEPGGTVGFKQDLGILVSSQISSTMLLNSSLIIRFYISSYLSGLNSV